VGGFLAFDAMQVRIDSANPDSYAWRYGEFSDPYDAEAHLRWLLGLPEIWGRLENLRQRAEHPRRYAGRPWYEYGFLDVEGDTRAIRRWRGEQRRFAQLLPPNLRKLVPLLVRDPSPPIEIPGGRALSPARAERLQANCLRKLTRGSPPLSGAERQHLFRDLRALDPSREPLLTLVGSGLASGATTAICATSAKEGAWVAAEPQAGYPNVGLVATQMDQGTGIEPFPLEGVAPVPTEKFEFIR
jgi:hypothetical protein